MIFTDPDFLTFNVLDIPTVKVSFVLDKETGFTAAEEKAVPPPVEQMFAAVKIAANAIERHFLRVAFFIYFFLSGQCHAVILDLMYFSQAFRQEYRVLPPANRNSSAALSFAELLHL